MGEKHIIRVRNGFSDRNNIKPISKQIQFTDFTPETRISLFNAVVHVLDYQISTRRLDTDWICQHIIEGLFNEVYYRYSDNYGKTLNEILELFKIEPYDDILTMIEFLCSMVYESPQQYKNRNTYDSFLMSGYINTFKEMNVCLEEECTGYRFVKNQIVKITNKHEIDSIEEAAKTPYDAVNDSISKSVSLISENSRDYENSIKESILAIEQLLNILLNTKGVTMGKATDQLFNKFVVNENLRDALKNLYKYASDTNGIRHGNNKEKTEITFEEAKFILVLSSASINYLVSLKKN